MLVSVGDEKNPKCKANIVMHCSWSSSSIVTFVVIINFPDELLELVCDLNEVNYEINDKFSSMVQSISMPNISKVVLLDRNALLLRAKVGAKE